MPGMATFFLAAMVGYHLNGTYGMAVGAGIGWALSAAITIAMHGPVNKKYASYERMAEKGLKALEGLRRELEDGDEWQDIKRLLRNNPDISPANLESSREAVLWRYSLERQLPTSDMDMLDTYGRFIRARSTVAPQLVIG